MLWGKPQTESQDRSVDYKVMVDKGPKVLASTVHEYEMSKAKVYCLRDGKS